MVSALTAHRLPLPNSSTNMAFERPSPLMNNDSLSGYPLRPQHKHTYTSSTLDASGVHSALSSTTWTTDELYGTNSQNALVPGRIRSPDEGLVQAQPEYRLYKRRFSGLAAVVRQPLSLLCAIFSLNPPDIFHSQVLLNAVSGMAGAWFGPISEEGTLHPSFSSLVRRVTDCPAAQSRQTSTSPSTK